MNDGEKINAVELHDGSEAAGRAVHPLLDSLDLRIGHSNHVLVRMVIIALVIVGAVVWQFDLIRDIYIRHQIEGIGPLINSSILILFAAGLVRLVMMFVRYAGEEAALNRFIRNVSRDSTDPIRRVPVNSLISRRYLLMRAMYEQRVLINHSALASMLLAGESTRTSMARFINNILILAGVFGTIVSLSVALLGASDLLTGTGDTDGMSTVLSGMSTALSTTITAIVCYLYFGYFFLKLRDVQTNVINNVEQVTAALLMPKFSLRGDTVMQDISALAHKLQKLVGTLEESQARYSASGQKLLDAVSSYGIRGQSIAGDISTIKQLLRSGFRLYEGDENEA